MSKRWAYILGVLFLLVIRFGVLDTNYDEWLYNIGYDGAGDFIFALKESDTFNKFFGGFVVPIFVFTVLAYWAMNVDNDEEAISKQFLLLPLAFIPFSIIAKVLEHATFTPDMLFVHPLIILPFGYLYIGIWKVLIWIFVKCRLIEE